MTKQEFIKQEWLKFIGIQVYDSLKLSNELSDDGWREVNYLPFDYEKKYDVLKFNKTRFAVRPKSISGIENNNGWVKIESEADLPKENIECFYRVVVSKPYINEGEYINTGRFRVKSVLTHCENFFTIDDVIRNYYPKVTHYMPIEKPQPPIY